MFQFFLNLKEYILSLHLKNIEFLQILCLKIKIKDELNTHRHSMRTQQKQ